MGAAMSTNRKMASLHSEIDSKIRPCDKLKRMMVIQNWSQKDFATVVKRPLQTINEILKGRKRITARTAIEFGLVLKIKPETILRWQTDYELYVERRNRKQLDEHILSAIRELLD